MTEKEKMLETENEFLRKLVITLGAQIHKIIGEKGPVQDLEFVQKGMPVFPPDQL